MTFLKTAILAALVAAPSATFAQGFTGAELSAGMMAYAEDTNLGASSYSGGLEFGVISGVGVALDISRHNWRGRDGNSTSYTLHGLYELSTMTSVGLFIGQDRRREGDSDIYGIEGAAEFGAFSVDGWLGKVDGDLGDGTMLGLNGAFAFTPAIAATASLGLIETDSSVSTITLGGEYRFGNGPFAFAEAGRADNDGDGETFIKIGGRVELGRGTTFGPRGLTDTLSGF